MNQASIGSIESFKFHSSRHNARHSSGFPRTVLIAYFECISYTSQGLQISWFTWVSRHPSSRLERRSLSVSHIQVFQYIYHDYNEMDNERAQSFNTPLLRITIFPAANLLQTLTSMPNPSFLISRLFFPYLQTLFTLPPPPLFFCVM